MYRDKSLSITQVVATHQISYTAEMSTVTEYACLICVLSLQSSLFCSKQQGFHNLTAGDNEAQWCC